MKWYKGVFMLSLIYNAYVEIRYFNRESKLYVFIFIIICLYVVTWTSGLVDRIERIFILR